ncbi:MULTISPECIES: hypothetical protein [unclassified Actinobaculum]|uniref:hypothetical protein n=1 Tax=unclassified Actinobaculum TaxID=2609299 RepID=UPI000D528B28|nr:MULTISPECIES: hypothetical protein [unclassified Actinobaculum]AWE41770.1 hypothetical protein DDD63_02230 [Actinobaculum sp. 313]RTE50312.1 hypothetical protein EKN07_03670 [Actinobaculum sp. 352]
MMASGFTFEVPPDTAGECERVAYRLEQAGGRVAATQVATATGGVPGWIGESADAYTDQILAVGGKARKMADALRFASSPLREYADKVKETIRNIGALQEDYDAAEAAYEAKTAEIDEAQAEVATNAVTPYTQGDVDAWRQRVDQEWQETVVEFNNKYKGLLTELDEVADSTAAKVLAAQDEIINPDVPHSSRWETGLNIFGDVPLVAGAIEWKTADKEAREIATVISDPNLTAEDVEAFNTKYGDKIQDPFVANALLQYVSADDLVRFSLRIDRAYSQEDMAANPDLDREVRDDVLCAIGTTIALGTGGMNLAGDNAERQILFEQVRDGIETRSGKPLASQTQRFVEDLKMVGRTEYDQANLDSNMTCDIGTDGYDIILQLVGEAGYANPELTLGPGFFEPPAGGGVSVAQDIVAMDAEEMRWKGERTPQAQFGTYIFGSDRAVHEPLQAMYMLMDRPESLDPQTGDPALLAADRRRLDSVQLFFAGDTPTGMDINHDGVVDSNDKPMNMTRYLTGGRTYATWEENQYYGFEDGGEQFGRVLQQAADTGDVPDRSQMTDEEWEQWQKRDMTATTIAANFLFGYQDGLDVVHDFNMLRDTDKVDGQDAFGYHNPNLRSWAGLILEPHVDGIALSLLAAGSSNGVVATGNGDYQIVFDTYMRAKLLGPDGVILDLGFDEPELNNNGTPDDESDDYWEGGRAPAIDNLLVASQRGYEEELDDALDGVGGTPPKDVVQRWNPMLEALFTVDADASDEAKHALDVRNARWKGYIMAGAGAIPGGAFFDESDKVANYFFDQTKANGVAPVVDFLLPTNNEEHGDQAAATLELNKYMEQAVYQSMSTHGSFEDFAQTPEEFIKTDTQNLEPFFDENGDIIPYADQTDKQRTSYERYIQNQSGGSGYVEIVNSVGGFTADSAAQHSNAYDMSKRYRGK